MDVGGLAPNLKAGKINNARGASAKSKKVRDVSNGGWGGWECPEERPHHSPHDVHSRGQNRYVTLPLRRGGWFQIFFNKKYCFVLKLAVNVS